MSQLSDRAGTRTLILEVALPDFWCDDYDFDDPEMGEILREFCEGNLTPEGLADAALEDAGLTSARVHLALLTGSKDGNFVEHMKGRIVGSRVVLREPDHEHSDDDRLDEMLEDEALRLPAARHDERPQGQTEAGDGRAVRKSVKDGESA